MIDLLLMFALAGPLPGYATPHWAPAPLAPEIPSSCVELCGDAICVLVGARGAQVWSETQQKYIWCIIEDWECANPEEGRFDCSCMRCDGPL